MLKNIEPNQFDIYSFENIATTLVLNYVSSYFPAKFYKGEKQVWYIDSGGGLDVLPALLAIKVDIQMSERYSRQPQASNRKLMTRLCMWHSPFMCKTFSRSKKVVRYF